VVVDVDGRVRRINTAGIALLDLQAPAEGDGDAEGGDSETSERVRVELPPLHLSLRGQTVRNFEHQITRRDGETTWLNVSSAPLFDRGGSIHGAVAGFQDVSERRRLEQAKDEFLAVTAHELRTPVTALLGYTNLLVKRAELGDWGDRDLHALRMIETQAQRLTQLVNGLIDVSRVQTGSIELQRVRVELRALIEQSAAAARAQAVDHTIVVDASEHPVHVFGDPQRLDQIVTQLIGNALKYSPWGGTVRVGVWANDVAHITVTDDGIGIPDQAIPQLFDRFYRATNVDSDRISGLGIGLYLAKELVAAHDGEISVRSQPGEGTTFEIQLPLRSEDA
jgi:signal transduction histidine kinase